MVTTEFPHGPEFPILCISNKWCQARLSLYGAHLLDWTPNGQQPVIFLSPKVQFQAGKALRGGVPLCWPWFGKNPNDASAPSHGVARTQLWELSKTEEDETCTRIVLSLPTSDPMLPNAAAVFEFGADLGMSLLTVDVPHQMPFSAAQHTYFAVSDYEKIAITGVEECPFTEFSADPGTQIEDPLIPAKGIDRIYHPVPAEQEICIHDPAWNRSIRIHRTGSQSCVIWNPGAEGAADMVDLGTGNERGMICLESAVVPAELVSLRHNEVQELSTRIQVVSLED